MGLTLEEVEKRRLRDVWVLAVKHHKMSEKGLAMVTLDRQDLQHLLKYIDNIRPQVDPTGQVEQVLVKPGTPPQALTSLQPLLKHLEATYQMRVPTATAYRKAVASMAAQRCSLHGSTTLQRGGGDWDISLDVP